MKYGIEVLVTIEPGVREWRRVRPTNGPPYVFETWMDAERNRRLCYDADPTVARIVELGEGK